MPKFNIISQFLKDISFESPNMPELFFKREESPAKVEFNINIQIQGAENNLYLVNLIVTAHSKIEKDEKTIFLIESTYTGLVHCEETDEEAKKRTLLIDVPTLLFPAVRSLITRLTSESGFPPVSMQPVDFAALYEQQKQNAAAKPAEQKPANQ